MAEAVIADAVVAAGHGGEAELVLRVRYENGGLGSLTLDAERARKLMEDCGVESAAALRGQPCRRLLDALRPNGES